MKNKLIKFVFILFISFSTILCQFGQNIVQYDNFNWNYIQSNHFDIYYYDVGKVHANFVAHHAEEAYDNISYKLNWDLKNRVSIIVYNSHNDFQQTNVIDTYMSEGIGGVTELYKNRIVIPFDGSNKEFKHVIHHELVHAFINDYIYGGSIQNLVSNQIKVQIPLWMNEGLAEYLSSKWNTNSDMWIRDLAINGDVLPKIEQLIGYMAYRGGQSVWRFITYKWGEESIEEIFRQIKKFDNVNKGLKNSIGVEIKDLTEKWHKYIKQEYWPDVVGRQNLDDFSRKLTDHIKLENSYNIAPALSPDGSKIAIISNKTGTMSIYLISADDGRFLKRIIRGERNAEYEELHILKPGISWSNDGKRIVFSAKSGKSDALFIADIINNQVKKYEFDMEGIFRTVWSPNGEEIAFIGNDGIQSDIYIYNLITDVLENITNDWFSDDQVSWSKDNKSLLFISDRGDYINNNRPSNINKHNIDQLDIYEITRTEKTITRITNTSYSESYPLYTNDKNSIIYISDEYGINNINILNIDNNKTVPITNTLTGISQLSWNNSNSHLIFSGFEKSGYDIYIMSNPTSNLNKNINIEYAKWITKNDTISISKNKLNKKEYFQNNVSYKNYIFSEDYFSNNNDTLKKNIKLPLLSIQDSIGNFISHEYKVRFTLDLIQGYAYNSALYAPNAMIQFLFSDILGNHKFFLATEMQISLEDSDYYLMYKLLPFKIDYSFSFFHMAEHYQNYYGDLIRLRNFGIGFDISKPISRFQRFEFGFNYNYIEEASFTQVEQNNYETAYGDKNIDHQLYIAKPSLGYVWDNTLWSQMYPIDGIRTSINFDISHRINSKSLEFHTFTLDLRKYKSLFNGVSFAGRLYIGKSYGQDSQNFLLGGLPWLFSSEGSIYANDPRTEENTLENIFVSEYVMPLRGSQINQINGNNAILINLELRLPFLIYYFPSIKYLGQINGVFFSDIGSAWVGKKPDFWIGDPWDSNPKDFIWTYGLGPRFILLGLPIKLDYAWEYIPNKKTDRMWYISIGLDF